MEVFIQQIVNCLGIYAKMDICAEIISYAKMGVHPKRGFHVSVDAYVEMRIRVKMPVHVKIWTSMGQGRRSTGRSW